MSLFSSLNVGVTSLQAQMAAIQVAGHNIANANTPGYSRQKAEFEAMRPQDWGFAQVGTGVRVARVRRVIDEMLSLRIQTATSTLSNLDINSQTLQRMEALFNELSTEGANLSGAMTKFFNSIDDLASNPDKTAARAQVTENGQALAETFNNMGSRIKEMRESLDKDLGNTITEINRISSDIAGLNDTIVSAENAGNDPKTANDLRDKRDMLLEQLSGLVSIKPIEASNGSVNVLAGGNFIVFGKTAYEVAVKQDVNRGVLVSTPYFTTSGAELDIRGGSLKGMIESRDAILNQYSDSLDTLAKSLMFEINKVHSEGVGLERFTSLTGTEAVLQPAVSGAPVMTEGKVESTSGRNVTDSSLKGYALDLFNGMEIMMTSGANAGQRRSIKDFDGTTGTLVLDSQFDYEFTSTDAFQITSFHYPIKHGSFDLNVTNEQTGAVDTFTINVNLDKVGSDSTLTDIVNDINNKAGGAGITASITAANKLKIESSSSNKTFTFTNDTSDFLAAIGMNTFFSGTGSEDMEVNELVRNNLNYLAAAQSNTPSDNSNALAMAALKSAKTMQNGMATFEDFYQGVVGTLGVETASAQDQFTSQELLAEQLDNERARISGVNLDEEAVNLIEYQRTYQAAARYISVVDSMLQTLMNSI